VSDEDNNVIFGSRKPRLIHPDGGYIGPKPEPVVPLRTTPVPIAGGEGEHWTSALDVLRELIVDIEAGRISPPEVIYISMQCRNPLNELEIKRPAYSWVDDRWKIQSRLVLKGLLAHHQESL
jgi:hypothetical protein